MPSEDKTGEPSSSTSTNDAPIELESQFILRLPSVPAASLKAAVASGVMNLKDRLSIQLESDMRHGTVRFDGWVLPAKVVDLPTIIESHKTLDRKNFYKTADICQMMICKEESDDIKVDDDEKDKKTKDGKDKKFQYPHGITQPLKNVRKKRFRKTLKKKYVDFPEIEKEVKRLLRMDNEASHVRYEVVNADDEVKADGTKVSVNSSITGGNSAGFDVGEHDLFGEHVSSSDDDDTRVPDSDDGSRLSITNSGRDNQLRDDKSEKLVTEFPRGMLTSESDITQNASNSMAQSSYDISLESSSAAAAVAALAEDTAASTALARGVENEALYDKLQEIENEIRNLQSQRHQQQMTMDGMENIALKQRFQSIIDDLKEQETAKRREYDEIMYMLNQ